MYLSERIRQFRVSKNLSQGDMEKRTGLFRCYISRVENGHTVPSIETLEKITRAIEIPMYELFYQGEEPPEPLKVSTKSDEKLWGNSRGEALELNRLRQALAKMQEKRRNVLLGLASRIASRSK